MSSFLITPLTGVLAASALLVLTGVLAWMLRRRGRRCQAAGQIGTLAACCLGAVSTAMSLYGGGLSQVRLAAGMWHAHPHFALDALSALFLLPIFVLTAVAALYGRGYLADHEGEARLGTTWLYLTVLAAAMIIVLVARDALLFLLAWEAMALSPFFLVSFEHEHAEVRYAAWVYLVAAHLGTAFLLVMFLLLGSASGSLDFDGFAAGMAGQPALSSLVFVLALTGFGAKAGLVPMHVWLPEAHPVAPSHVSALMSGVMIKTGIYGLVRVLTFLSAPAPWWGWALIVAGALSGVLGVAFALAQHDLKRLLAYHSVENVGIIVLGLGVGVLGMAHGLVPLAVLGFAGALLHVINHSMFKGLLFLGAGAVLRGAKTLDLDRLGGLQRRMPWTAATFLVGAVAIVGLFPLNGFVSEFLVFFAGFSGLALAGLETTVGSLCVLASLGLISGLAAACFVKAYGSVFLGTPRTPQAATAREVPMAMRMAMAVLAFACVVLGLAGPQIIRGLSRPVFAATGLPVAQIDQQLTAAADALTTASLCLVVVLAITAGLWIVRAALLRRAGVHIDQTWGCGYSMATPRMQYTASSFAQPLTRQLGAVLRTRETPVNLDTFFAERVEFHSETPDLFVENLFSPLFLMVEGLGKRLRWLQHGNVHLYVLYVAATLIGLLVWKVAG